MTHLQTINCPHCRKNFELSEALSNDLEAKFQEDLNQALKNKEDAFNKRIKDIEAQKVEIEKNAEIQKRQLKEQLKDELSKKIREETELQNKDLQNQLQEQKKKIQLAQQNELQLMKKQRELEEQKQEFELAMNRKLMEEKQNLTNELKMKLDLESKLKIGEKDKELNDLKSKISELERKTQVTSQQLQGEVLELQIEEMLRSVFPEDNIEEIKKGAKGADVNHEVLLSSGRKAGTILYECKQASDWKPLWIDKLKENMRERNIEIGVIVSAILPKDIKFMGMVDGIWVCSPTMLKQLVLLLRDGLIRAARAELAAATPQDQQELLFKYMTSAKFTQKIQAMCEITSNMRETLESEKRSLQKNWKKREEEIEGFGLQIVNLYGELQGVVGKALPKVEHLELDYTLNK